MFRPKRYEIARIVPVGNLWCKYRPRRDDTCIKGFLKGLPTGTILAPKVSHRDDPCTFAYLLAKGTLAADFLSCVYQRYGESDGYPSQQGLIRDAQAAVDHLSQRTDIDTSQIVVFGRSLGGAVGVAVTKNNPDKVAALILENTFTSILDMAGVLLPFLKYFIGGSLSKGPKILNFVVRSPWNTLDIVGQVKQPILFLSGQRDEMIPPLHMQMLYAKAAAHNKRCTFVEFPSGMHMDTWIAGGDHYWKTVQTFLRQNFIEKKGDESEPDRNGACCFCVSIGLENASTLLCSLYLTPEHVHLPIANLLILKE
ncbi:bem46-like protein [Tanacetum coccineum]